MKRSKEEYKYRETVISRIEGMAGTLEFPWEQIETKELEKLDEALTKLWSFQTSL